MGFWVIIFGLVFFGIGYLIGVAYYDNPRTVKALENMKTMLLNENQIIKSARKTAKKDTEADQHLAKA